MHGDCAAVGWWSANAVSAAGYLLAAGTLAWGSLTGRLPRHSLVLAAAVALEGAGSFLAHGAGGDGAILVHDLALLAMVGYVAGWHLGRLVERAGAGAVAGSGAATLVGAAAWPWYRGAGSLVAASAVAATAVSEVAARRRGAPAVWTGSLLAAAAVAAVAWLAGRTGSPLCDPGSPYQLHALWHLLTAYVVAAWAFRAAAVDTA
jgi:hypothetical protein